MDDCFAEAVLEQKSSKFRLLSSFQIESPAVVDFLQYFRNNNNYVAAFFSSTITEAGGITFAVSKIRSRSQEL